MPPQPRSWILVGMSYAIEITGEARLRGEIQRIALERIGSARKGLRKLPDDVDERIHGIRRDLKKLRALLRLVREPLGKSTCKREDRTFRDAARKLAPFRDAAARVALVESLREKEMNPVSASAMEAAAKEVRGVYRKTVRKGKVKDAAREADALLKDAEKRVKQWTFEGPPGFGWFREGLEDMYARCRRDLARCLIHPTAENFHDWRKCGKYLRYQIDLMHLASPADLEPAEKKLHALTDLLGSHHDLAVLGETLEPLADGTLDDAELWAIHQFLESENRSLMKRCWASGRRLFAETTEVFIGRIGGYWEGKRPI